MEFEFECHIISFKSIQPNSAALYKLIKIESVNLRRTHWGYDLIKTRRLIVLFCNHESLIKSGHLNTMVISISDKDIILWCHSYTARLIELIRVGAELSKLAVILHLLALEVRWTYSRHDHLLQARYTLGMISDHLFVQNYSDK